MIGRILCALGRHRWRGSRGYESLEWDAFCERCGKEWGADD